MKKRSSYSPLSKFLHWSIVTLVALQFLTSFVMSGVDGNNTPNFFLNLHMSFGVFIAPLAFILLCMRFLSPVEKTDDEINGLQAIAANAMHYLLYVLLILIPVCGDAFAFSHGVTVKVFGLFALPQLFSNNSSLVSMLGEAHSVLAWTIGVLVAGHISAALYHHYVAKDRVLTRMLPGRK